MARFWKRGTDRSVERLLRANRPEPRDWFASTLLAHVEAETARKRRVSMQRYRLALVMAVLLVAVAAALGGIGAATAGVGNVVHAAANVVSPAKTDTTSSGKQSSTQNTSPTNNKDKDDQGSSADDEYKVGICHRSGNAPNYTYKLMYLPPSAIPAHLAHGDHFPDQNGNC